MKTNAEDPEDLDASVISVVSYVNGILQKARVEAELDNKTAKVNEISDKTLPNSEDNGSDKNVKKPRAEENIKKLPKIEPSISKEKRPKSAQQRLRFSDNLKKITEDDAPQEEYQSKLVLNEVRDPETGQSSEIPKPDDQNQLPEASKFFV